METTIMIIIIAVVGFSGGYSIGKTFTEHLEKERKMKQAEKEFKNGKK